MRNSVYGQSYKEFQIRADCRVHETVADIACQWGGATKALLDIACGQGALSERLKDCLPACTVDVNDIDVEQVKFQGYRNRFNIDLNSAVEIDETYDLIVAVEIIEHIGNPQHLLQEMKRLLKSDGKIILSTPAIDAIYDRLFFMLKGRFMYFTDHHLHESGHIMPLAMWQLKALCKEVGLQIKQTRAVNWQMRIPSKAMRLCSLLPYLPFMKNRHQTSINVMVLEHT